MKHELFTVGNIKWNINKEKGYLATRDEIMNHFKHCIDLLKAKPHDIVEMYNFSYIQHLEVTNENYNVEVTCKDQNGDPLVIHANKLVKAFGKHLIIFFHVLTIICRTISTNQ